MYINNGFCKFIGKEFCNIGTTFMLLSFGQISWSTLASFVYRYWVLTQDAPTKKTVGFWIIIMQIPMVFGLCVVVSEKFCS